MERPCYKTASVLTRRVSRSLSGRENGRENLARRALGSGRWAAYVFGTFRLAPDLDSGNPAGSGLGPRAQPGRLRGRLGKNQIILHFPGRSLRPGVYRAGDASMLTRPSPAASPHQAVDGAYTLYIWAIVYTTKIFYI